MRPDKVLVEMELSKRAVRTLANVPPIFLQNDETIAYRYSPKTVSITIEGPEEVIKNIVSDKISILIDITTKKPGTYRLQPEVKVPPGIDKFWLDIDAFEITILPPDSGRGGGNEKR